ncbi:hypothetical protein DL96DRAFT_1687404, partial [Flagelloscypha sp. PMI_526]
MSEMPQTLPPEIWVQILAFLPLASLHVAKHANHEFYRICGDWIFRELNLVTAFTEQNVEEQLQVLKSRLNLARSHPTLIKCLRFMPSLVMPNYPSWKPAQKKPLISLRRLFRKAEEEPIRWPELHPAFDEASDVYDGLNSLIPSLTSLEELYIRDNSKWYGGWNSTADLAFKVTASRLTVLSLQYGYTTGPSSALASTEDADKIALPLLRTFRLCLTHSHNDCYESHVKKFTSASPLLQELQYLITCHSIQDGGSSHVIKTPAHPHLRVFKWASIVPWGPPSPLPPSFGAN